MASTENISEATLTDSFLDFTASRGNNLQSIGLTAGCKWCLYAGRWKEALDAESKNKDLPKDVVSKFINMQLLWMSSATMI